MTWLKWAFTPVGGMVARLRPGLAPYHLRGDFVFFAYSYYSPFAMLSCWSDWIMWLQVIKIYLSSICKNSRNVLDYSDACSCYSLLYLLCSFIPTHIKILINTLHMTWVARCACGSIVVMVSCWLLGARPQLVHMLTCAWSEFLRR